MFGSMAPGLSLLKQMGSMGGQPGGLAGAGANAIDGGFIAKLMSGNPGGLIGALMNRRNAPVNPGVPPPPGSDAYVPGGVGPAMPAAPAAGAPGGIGMLAKLFPQMGQFGGASGAPRFTPGDLAGW